ncbi:MAG TPA: NAD(P)H-hydrate dehydratase, partial [Anaerolineae bacterium]
AKSGIDERRAFRAQEKRSNLVSIAEISRGAGEQGSRGANSPPHPGNRRLPTPAPLLPVVAIDCPSGMNTDTGALDPVTIPADLTVTFAGPKRGHFKFPGAAACGELVVADIGIPADLPEVQSVLVELVTADYARQLLPPRPADGHKGTFGKALIVAGSGEYWGAPVLAARAALRTGAGLVALAVPEKIRPTIAGQLPEATYPPVADQTTFNADGARFLLEKIDSYQALLVGPGLGEAESFLKTFLGIGEAIDFIQDRLADKGQDRLLPPLVVDADGLNLLSQMEEWPGRLPPNTILTPHPGEMARLMGIPLSELRQMDRIDVAREKAAEWNHVVLLKGAYTVIAAPDGRCALLPFANPALATGGTGDVLAGVIVSLLAQGLEPYEAAILGGYLHGAAAESYGKKAGLLAHELADFVPEMLSALR